MEIFTKNSAKCTIFQSINCNNSSSLMCPTQNCLEKLGHPQPQTPLKTDNTNAVGIANDTVKQKHSKAIDMQFYWICL